MRSPNGIAVITGASSGIGAVYADRLAALSARGLNRSFITERTDP